MFKVSKRLPKQFLGLLLAGSLAACVSGDSAQTENTTQLIQGTIPLSQYSADVIGVRVVAQNQQVAAATTDTNGNFAIQVPVGQDYSFEIVTKSGTYSVLAGPLNGTTPMLFDVCDPGEDFDLGDIDPIDFEEIDGDETPWTDSEEDCEVPPWICEDGSEDCLDEPSPCEDPASDPAFCWEEPLPCEDPVADPTFCWDDPIEPPCEDPEDCGPIEPPCEDPEDCGPIEPPCADPAADPANCGGGEPPWEGECEDGYDDPTCWPEPEICVSPDGDLSECDEDVGGAPEFPFPDFGCDGDDPVPPLG